MFNLYLWKRIHHQLKINHNQKIMSNLFTITALKNLKQTGSLFRSSKTLANKLIEPLDRNKDLVVIELGAGDGIITKQILNRIGLNSYLHSFEINLSFVPILKTINDERLTIHNTCVSNLATIFSENKVDFVVSCLPLANIEHTFKKQLIEDVKFILKDSGSLIQYQYSKKDLEFLKNNFTDTSTTLCIKNIPPAFIYNCKN
ncbi:class I SAM-dependent methyltransferase [Aquimarina megaterium]|uniref:class I SAM-dependent methyltransferase n=1 Tax=Aquimarina megaterium TaxID=1443666 RepID=UPI000472BC48|nr:rRNA adenine N-6-methyltransferase family protein [Aquimarina megaterium]